MAISPLHHAFVNGTEIDPSFIKLGDLLHTPHGLEPVTRIETLEARGAYHPFVKGGNYFVDGILASDYYGLVPKAVWSLGRAYVEARFWLGIPVIPVGKGDFPDHAWAAGSLGRAGVPLWAQKTAHRRLEHPHRARQRRGRALPGVAWHGGGSDRRDQGRPQVARWEGLMSLCPVFPF